MNTSSVPPISNFEAAKERLDYTIHAAIAAAARELDVEFPGGDGGGFTSRHCGLLEQALRRILRDDPPRGRAPAPAAPAPAAPAPAAPAPAAPAPGVQELNIGLDGFAPHLSVGARALHAEATLRLVAWTARSPLGNRSVTRVARLPDREPTLAVRVTGVPISDADVHHVASLLSQDYIAVWDAAGGRLIGPRAAAWGAFDPSLFVRY